MTLAHDDDGIIDLRALASTPPPRGAFAIPSPFASEPPPAFTRDADDVDGTTSGASARSAKGRTIGIVVGAAAVLALGCAGIGFAFRGATAAPPRAAAAALAAPPPAPPPAEAKPEPAPEAAGSAASADDRTAAAETKKTKGGKARSGGAKATKAAAAPAKAAVSKATSSDACNCHGDFQCNIRCAANK